MELIRLTYSLSLAPGQAGLPGAPGSAGFRGLPGDAVSVQLFVQI